MTPARARRLARARRACRAYLRECDGPREEIGFPSGLVGRMAHRALNRRDRRDGGPFGFAPAVDLDQPAAWADGDADRVP